MFVFATLGIPSPPVRERFSGPLLGHRNTAVQCTEVRGSVHSNLVLNHEPHHPEVLRNLMFPKPIAYILCHGNAGSLTADRNLELNTWLDTAEGHSRKRIRIACFKLRGRVPPGTCQIYAGLPRLSTAANPSPNCGAYAT